MPQAVSPSQPKLTLTPAARPWLFRWADSIWPDGVPDEAVSEADQERACSLWAMAGKLTEASS